MINLADLQRRLASERTLTLTVRCRPGAKVPKVGPVLADGSLKVSVRAKAEDGRANDELLELLPATFPAATAALLSGQTSRQKMVRLTLT